MRIEGKDIEYKTEVKYLGITLDSKLYWTKHIDEKIMKTKKYLGKIAHMTRDNWGPKPKLMRWVYIGVVRPMLCYGAMIWGHRAPELAEKFRRLNRMAMNTFANFPKSTPTAALEIMLDLLPLHLFCTQEAVAARIRLDEVLEFGWQGVSHTKTHSVSHMRFLNGKLEQYNLDPRNTDRCHVNSWGQGFKINWDSFDGQAKHRQPSQYNVYTDGSRLDNQTGSGMVIYKGGTVVTERSFRLPDGTTVFQAEVAAIAKAAEALCEMGAGAAKFVKIFVDSQAAITAVGNMQVTSKTVAWAVESLNRLADKTESVTLVWIPAHRGYEGNERADVLAKTGSKESGTTNSLEIGIPTATLKSQVRECVYEEWRGEWTGKKFANHTKSFYACPNRGKAKFVYKLARLELGRLVRIITGHNNLNFFQNKLGLARDPSCRHCGEGNETVTHFLEKCPVFRQARVDILQDRIPNANMKWSVRQLLDFSYIPGINAAYEGSWGEKRQGEAPTLDCTLDLGWLDGRDDPNNNTAQSNVTQ